MVTMKPHVILYGVEFSPSVLEIETGLALSDKIERGSIGTMGRYRGTTVPYGSATLFTPSDVTEELGKLLWCGKQILKHKETLTKNGTEDITFHIDIEYDDQCNFDFDPEFLRLLGDLAVPLTVSCCAKE